MLSDTGRIHSSQTIGVEFASKIIRVGTGTRRKRIKLQLWDTAGTERFRSVSRSYYRGAAGAVLVYDIGSHASFNALPTFLNDARALASPNLTLLLAGNKSDIASGMVTYNDQPDQSPTARSALSNHSRRSNDSNLSVRPPTSYGLGSQSTATVAVDGREVPLIEASQWASLSSIPVSVEVSAFTGEGVEDVFSRLARMILIKIELGEIDPDDPQSGIQYGDSSAWRDGDGGSVKSGVTTLAEGGVTKRRRRGRRGTATRGWGGLREWEEVFRLDSIGRRRRSSCC